MKGNWRERISKMETAPPPGAWENIAERLDTDGYKWKNKIYKQVAVPPASAWQQIETELNRKQENKIVLVSKYYSWIAAAAAFVIIAGSVVFLNRQAPASSQVANNNPVKKNNDSSISTEENTAAVKTSVDPDLTTAAENTAAREAVPANVTASNTSNISRIVRRPAIAASLSKAVSTNNQTATANHYITVCGPENQPVKLSSKFQPVLGFLNNHSYVDDILDGCEDWKQKVCEWRDKMLNAPVIPSGDNFSDIIDFAKTISEDNK